MSRAASPHGWMPGCRPLLEDPPPDVRCDRRRHEQLVPAFSRVSGARDHQVPSVPGRIGAMHVGERFGLREQRPDHLRRPWPLDGDEGEVVPDRERAAVGSVRREPLVDAADVGGVRHHEVPVVRDAVHDQVVHDPALVVQGHPVLRRPDRHAGEVVRQGALQRVQGRRTGYLDLAEVRDVEGAHALPDRRVLGERPRVLDGQQPAPERPELRAQRRMLRLQGRASQLLGHVRSPISGRLRVRQ